MAGNQSIENLASAMANMFEEDSDNDPQVVERVRPVRTRLRKIAEHSSVNYIAMGNLLWQDLLGQVCPKYIILCEALNYINKRSHSSWEYPLVQKMYVEYRARGTSEKLRVAVIIAILKFYVPRVKWELMLWDSKRGVFLLPPTRVELNSNKGVCSESTWTLADVEGKKYMQTAIIPKICQKK